MEIYGIQIVTDVNMDRDAWELHYAPTMGAEIRKLKNVLECMGLQLDRIDISRVRQ